MTHLGSGWENLSAKLKENPNIDQVSNFNYSIHHPDHLQFITGQPHKTNDAKSVWLAPILKDMQMSKTIFRSLRKSQKFVFFLGRPNIILQELVENQKYTESNALAYYIYRIYGLYECWRHVPDAPWITSWSSDNLNEYLDLGFEPLHVPQEYSGNINKTMIQGCNELEEQITRYVKEFRISHPKHSKIQSCL